eukprot:CAMPEP_0195249164 /NCGR_PEP_ID=MMETSP0706-20130129/1960_1 /TAXON_ID=33640 /ORGANISM="Asterionellopsis glacialis, Strain CCMP134" /LENGTH=281 /DNA_ID=CAMNT_0040300929 /DNA_START=46 /DNA_END=891 /DNA_ORIENTATION=+
MTSIGARVVLAASSAARKIGQALDNVGASMEVAKYTEKLVPSTRFVAVDGVAPMVSESAAFVAPSASIVGNVSMGKNSSVWYGATVRGDVNKVEIGENTCIGDRAVIHVAKIQGDFPTLIGSNVTVGPAAVIHASTLEDSIIVGPSAQVLDGAVVGSNCILAPGAVVTPGTKVSSGELWAGSPAKKVRGLTPEEIESIADSAVDKAELASLHAVECAKDFKQLAEDEEEYEDNLVRDPDYIQKDSPDQSDVLGMGSPGRIFDSTLTNPEEGLKLRKQQEKE